MENTRFKFRVWNNEHKRYIEDNCYPIGGDYHLTMTKYGYVEVIGLGDYQDYSDVIHSWGVVKNIEDYIGDCVVEQCTGLNDKNGKLIYEGDICIPAKDMADKAGEVYRAESGAYFIKGRMKSGMEYDFGIYWHHYMYEIIGNIHENPELLEVQDE